MPHTILVADSAADRRIALQATLARGHYVCRTASDAAELIATARANPTDLILCDTACDRPCGVGSFLTRLRSATEASIPVVALTASDTTDARLAALRSGADAVLPRSAPGPLVLARIRSLLRNADTASALLARNSTVQALGLADPGAAYEMPASIALVADEHARAEIWAETVNLGQTATCKPLTLDQALTGLETSGPCDVIVIEAPLSHPGDAISLLADLRARAATRHAEVSVVHDRADIETATTALDVGASDLVMAGFRPDELSLRIRALVRRKREADTLRASLDQSLRLAVEDPLTGLYNRRYAMAHAERLSRSEKGYCVVLADIDRFKSINDSLGHAAGDAVLVEVARRLRDNVRSVDLVARIGGEEFLIFLPGSDPTAAENAAVRLCEVIRKTPISLGRGEDPIHVTASFGVAEAESGETLKGVLNHADTALYGAKAAGRDTVLMAASRAA